MSWKSWLCGWLLASFLPTSPSGLPAAAGARELPSIGPEFTLDPGYRYSAGASAGTCVVAPADSVVLLAYDSPIVGYRRGPGGREIDVNAVPLGPVDCYTGPFDIAPYDGVDWKFAYLARSGFGPGWSELRLRRIDRQSLQPVGPELLVAADSTGNLDSPVLAWTGERHLLAWVQSSGEGRILLRRWRSDLTPEDAAPVVVAPACPNGPIALAADAAGGIVVWPADGPWLIAQMLDASGTPVGAPVLVARGLDVLHGELEVCRFHGAWLLTWLDDHGARVVHLDTDGAVLPPGPGVFAPPEGIETLALNTYVTSGGDTLGALLWRPDAFGDAPVLITRLRPGLEAWELETRELDRDAPFQLEHHETARDLDLAWTGSELVCLWAVRPQLEIGKGIAPAGARADRAAGESTEGMRGGDRPDLAGRPAESSDEPGRVSAQWLSSALEPRMPEPALVSQTSRAVACGVHHGAQGFFAVQQDEATERWFHAQRLDGEGRPEGAPWRLRTDATGDRCRWDYCERSVLGRIGVRSEPLSASIVYGHDFLVDSWSGWWSHETFVLVDLVGGDGALVGRTKVPVDSQWGSGLAMRPVTCDAARGATGSVVTYSVHVQRESAWPLLVHAVLLNASGAPLREWTVASPYSCARPCVAAVEDRYLLVWLEEGPQPRLQRTVLTAETPAGEVHGEPLAPQLGFQREASLRTGEGQVLCVFGAAPDSTGDVDLYTLRFDHELRPRDAAPRPLCPGPGLQGDPSHIWDGRQWVVTWSDLDPGREAIFGARVAAGGAGRDSVPFLIAPGVAGRAGLAADGAETILVAYNSDRIRAVHDADPLLWDGQEDPPPDDPPDDPPPDDPPPDDPPPDEPPDDPPPDDPPPDDPPDDPPGGESGPLAVRIGGVRPNPGRGALHWDFDLPSSTTAWIEVFDAAGRCLYAERIEHRAVSGGWSWSGRRLDGGPAPAGTYFLKMRIGDRTAVRAATLLR